MAKDTQRIERIIRDLLEAIGENPDREGLLETPRRVAKMYEEISGGTHEEAVEVLGTI